MINRHVTEGSGYPVRPLAEVIEFLDHRRKPVKESDRVAGAYPYYGANGQQGTVDEYIFDEPLILLAEDGGHFSNPSRGIAYRIDGKTWVNNHAHVLRPRAGVDLGYLCRVLENYDVTPFVNGTTRSKLTKAGASEIPVPLPPLDEQKRIAAILDKADLLRQKRLQAIALLDSLTQSIFLEMFGGSHCTFDNALLDQVCSVIRDGAHATPKYVQSGVPFVTVKNISSGVLTFDGAKWVSQDTHAELTKRVKPERGDILVSKDGTIGIPALVDTDEEFSIFVSVALLKPMKNIVNPDFLVSQLRTDALQRQIREYSKGVAIRHLHLTDFRRLQIILPNIEMQNEFVGRAKKVQRRKEQMTDSLLQQEHLFASLQHRAFAGQL